MDPWVANLTALGANFSGQLAAVEFDKCARDDTRAVESLHQMVPIVTARSAATEAQTALLDLLRARFDAVQEKQLTGDVSEELRDKCGRLVECVCLCMRALMEELDEDEPGEKACEWMLDTFQATAPPANAVRNLFEANEFNLHELGD